MKKNYTSLNNANPHGILGGVLLMLLLLFYSVGYGQRGTIIAFPDAVCSSEVDYNLFKLFPLNDQPSDKNGDWLFNDGTGWRPTTDNNTDKSKFTFTTYLTNVNINFKYTRGAYVDETTVEVLATDINGTIKTDIQICTGDKSFSLTDTFSEDDKMSKGGEWTHNYTNSPPNSGTISPPNSGINQTDHNTFTPQDFVRDPAFSQGNYRAGPMKFTYKHCGFKKETDVVIIRQPVTGVPDLDPLPIYCRGGSDINSINLYDKIQGTIDSGGAWYVGESTNTVTNPSSLDLSAKTVGDYKYRYGKTVTSGCYNSTPVTITVVNPLDFKGATVSFLKDRPDPVTPDNYVENLNLCASDVTADKPYSPKIQLKQFSTYNLSKADGNIYIHYTIIEPDGITDHKFVHRKKFGDNITDLTFYPAGVVILDPYKDINVSLPADPANPDEDIPTPPPAFSATGTYTVKITLIEYEDINKNKVTCTKWQTDKNGDGIPDTDSILTGTFSIVQLKFSDMPISIPSICSDNELKCIIKNDPTFTNNPLKAGDAGGSDRYTLQFRYYYEAKNVHNGTKSQITDKFTAPFSLETDPAGGLKEEEIILNNTDNGDKIHTDPVKTKSHYQMMELMSLSDAVTGCKTSVYDYKYLVIVKSPDARNLEIKAKPVCLGEDKEITLSQPPPKPEDGHKPLEDPEFIKNNLEYGQIAGAGYTLKYKIDNGTEEGPTEAFLFSTPDTQLPINTTSLTEGWHTVALSFIKSNTYIFEPNFVPENPGDKKPTPAEYPLVPEPRCTAPTLPAAAAFFVYPPILIENATVTLTTPSLCFTERNSTNPVPNYTVTITSSTPLPDLGMDNINVPTDAVEPTDVNGYHIKYDVYKEGNNTDTPDLSETNWVLCEFDPVAAKILTFKAEKLNELKTKGEYRIKIKEIDYVFAGDATLTTCTTSHKPPTEKSNIIKFKEPSLEGVDLSHKLEDCKTGIVDFILSFDATTFASSEFVTGKEYDIDYEIISENPTISGTKRYTASVDMPIVISEPLPFGTYTLKITAIKPVDANLCRTDAITSVTFVRTYKVEQPKLEFTAIAVKPNDFCKGLPTEVTISGTNVGYNPDKTFKIEYSILVTGKDPLATTATSTSITDTNIVFTTDTLKIDGSTKINIDRILYTTSDDKECPIKLSVPNIISAPFTVKPAPDKPLFVSDKAGYCAPQKNIVKELFVKVRGFDAANQNSKLYKWYKDEKFADTIRRDTLIIDRATYFLQAEHETSGCLSPMSDGIWVRVHTIESPAATETVDDSAETPLVAKIPFCVKKTATSPQTEVTFADVKEKFAESNYKASLKWFYLENETYTTYKDKDLITGDYVEDEYEKVENGMTYFAVYYGNSTEENCPSYPLSVIPLLTAGCAEQSQIEDNLLIPDGFSPNGDNENNTFIIEGLRKEYPKFTMEIYNRFGKLVFKTDINGLDWDGKGVGAVGGKVVPSGVYFFVINYNDGIRTPRQGTVYVKSD